MARPKVHAISLVVAAIGSLLAASPAAAISVNGYGHYCSMTWPTGGWSFVSDTNGNDPCAAIMSKSDPGGSIQRAGIYSADGMNTVVARCTDNTVWLYKGMGNGPLTAAFEKGKGRPGCIFTVAPQNLPIFYSPFERNAKVRTTNGFDFARPPYNNLNVADFGGSGSSSAAIVNMKGNAVTFGDNHNGYDWVVAEGMKVYALADGVVHANRNFDTGCAGSNSKIQGEMYIRHTVERSPARYNEVFIAGYFHLKSRADLAAGTFVKRGTYLGEVGWVGCSSESHLHFVVTRTTNVANHYRASFRVPNNETEENNGGRWAIDPYGFRAPKNVDPWGWRAFADGNGALSINLWTIGSGPQLGNWAP